MCISTALILIAIFLQIQYGFLSRKNAACCLITLPQDVFWNLNIYISSGVLIKSGKQCLCFLTEATTSPWHLRPSSGLCNGLLGGWGDII